MNLGWGDRKERWAQGQALDAIGAFRYMADVHQSRGEVAEASRLMGLVKEVEGGLEAQLERALDLLIQGDAVGAQKMISQIEAAVVAESAAQQAAVHLAIGRVFLQTRMDFIVFELSDGGGATQETSPFVASFAVCFVICWGSLWRYLG